MPLNPTAIQKARRHLREADPVMKTEEQTLGCPARRLYWHYRHPRH
jgi:hypothetical protein